MLNMNKLSLSVMATVIAFTSSTAKAQEYTLANFNTNYFWARPSQGYYEVDVNLPGYDTPGFDGARIMAIGELNNDKTNDLVFVNTDATAF